MPDVEKVIKGLECCILGNKHEPDCDICPYSAGCNDTCDTMDEIHADALALLKEQEPMEPVLDIDTWKCGKCGHTLENQQLLGDNVLFHEQYNYCPECGRKVKRE